MRDLPFPWCHLPGAALRRGLLLALAGPLLAAHLYYAALDGVAACVQELRQGWDDLG